MNGMDRMAWVNDAVAVREERDDLVQRLSRHKCRNLLSEKCNVCGPMMKAWLLLRQMAYDLEVGILGVTEAQKAIMEARS